MTSGRDIVKLRENVTSWKYCTLKHQYYSKLCIFRIAAMYSHCTATVGTVSEEYINHSIPSINESYHNHTTNTHTCHTGTTSNYVTNLIRQTILFDTASWIFTSAPRHVGLHRFASNHILHHIAQRRLHLAHRKLPPEIFPPTRCREIRQRRLTRRRIITSFPSALPATLARDPTTTISSAATVFT
jgi:hypothetical protein